MEKVKVSAVCYTNSTPFVYGLEQGMLDDLMVLHKDIPSICAQKLIEDKVDVGLVPVAALLDMPRHHIIGDYCIGATGYVQSVFIFSQKPIREIDTLRLDGQSRTSNNLALVLFSFYWKRKVKLVEEGEDADAFVQIGDRTFGKTGQYPYSYDLAKYWMEFTHLPFAFAVWAANKSLDPAFVTRFNEALAYGLDHRQEVIAQLPTWQGFDVAHYLTHVIDYRLDEGKRKAIVLFHDYMRELRKMDVLHPYLQKMESVI